MSYSDEIKQDKELKNSYTYAYFSGERVEFVTCKITDETDTTITVYSEVCDELQICKNPLLKFGNNNYLDISNQQENKTHENQ